MKITVDTNVLVRAITGDDPIRGPLARHTLNDADAIYIPTPVLCELVWVLKSTYGRSRSDILHTLSVLLESERVITDASTVSAGLLAMSQGADFADGVIAHVGAAAGSEVFATFDKTASKVLASIGVKTLLLG